MALIEIFLNRFYFLTQLKKDNKSNYNSNYIFIFFFFDVLNTVAKLEHFMKG